MLAVAVPARAFAAEQQAQAFLDSCRTRAGAGT
jgi:hypothetical protein